MLATMASMHEFPLFDASVPVFRRYLQQLQGLLHKGAQHVPEAGHAALLQAQLAPGMLPLAVQAEVAVNFVFRACAPLAGQAVPPHGEHRTSFATLQARVAQGLAYLDTLAPADFAQAVQRQISDPAGDTTVTLDGATFLQQYVLPNFFFHLGMVYAILRQQGVSLGKADWDGWHVYPPAGPPA